MTIADGKYEVRGWYAGMVALWLFVGVPVLVLGVGFGGFLALGLWFVMNAVLFAPIMLAPYGIKRATAKAPQS